MYIRKRRLKASDPTFLTSTYKYWRLGYSRYSDSVLAGRSADRILVGTRSSAPVQTAPRAHPSTSKMGTEFLSRESARTIALAHHLLAQRLCMGSTISLPPLRIFMAYCRVTFTFNVSILVLHHT